MGEISREISALDYASKLWNPPKIWPEFLIEFVRKYHEISVGNRLKFKENLPEFSQKSTRIKSRRAPEATVQFFKRSFTKKIKKVGGNLAGTFRFGVSEGFLVARWVF